MEKALYKPGWGIELQGHRLDLADWRSALHPIKPDDPSVELVNAHGAEFFVLRCGLMDEIVEASEAQTVGKALHQRLNALFQIVREMENTTTGAMIRFDADKEPQRIALAVGNARLGRIRSRGVGVALSADGKELPPPKQRPSDIQRSLKMVSASGKQHLADAVIAYARADNWYDLFKAFEALSSQTSGKMVGWGWTSDDEIKRFKKTCHHYRHYEEALPPNPPTMEEARSFVRQLLVQALNHSWKGR